MWARLNILLVLGTIPAAVNVSAEEVRVYEEGGITYRETKSTVRVPVRKVRYEDRTQTCYREQYRTEFQDVSQTIYHPVVQYRWVPQWHDRWRIFQEPHLAYHLRGATVWQPQALTAQLPVTKREYLPETRVVRVPVVELAFEEREQVSRVAVSQTPPMASAPSPPGAAPTQVASRPAAMLSPQYLPPTYIYTPPVFVQPSYQPVVGLAQLDSDPPRQATAPHGEAWQARR